MKSVFQIGSIGLVLGCLALASGCSSDPAYLSTGVEQREAGVKLFDQGDYGNAAGAFRSAVKTEPRDYRAHFYLAQTYEKLGNYQQAIQCYRTGLDVIPTSTVAKNRDDKWTGPAIMQRTAELISKYDENGLEKALLAKKSDDSSLDSVKRAQAAFMLAKVRRLTGDADNAFLAYQKAADLATNDRAMQKEAGLYLHQIGKDREAFKYLDRAASIYWYDDEVNAALKAVEAAAPRAAEKLSR